MRVSGMAGRPRHRHVDRVTTRQTLDQTLGLVARAPCALWPFGSTLTRVQCPVRV